MFRRSQSSYFIFLMENRISLLNIPAYCLRTRNVNEKKSFRNQACKLHCFT